VVEVVLADFEPIVLRDRLSLSTLKYMSDAPKRTDPLWLRVIVALVFSAVIGVLTLVMFGDILGPMSLPIAGGVTVVSTVLMATKAKRVGRIATWFMELLSGF
jgi:hypothetical protein